MSMLGTLATLLDTIAGMAAAGASLYLLTLSVAALVHRPAPPVGPARHRITVLVPAHDEAALIGRCLRSLSGQAYPRELLRTVVVADNCTDDTAAIATAAGVEVLVRTDAAGRGKGRALRWALDRLLRDPWRPDAVVVVDADSVADPGLVAALEGHLAAGAEVVQAEYLALIEDHSPRSALRNAAFLLFHRTRFSGRAVLGMACNLVGNGMLFSRRVLEEHPWSAYTGAEDLEHSMDLRLAGVRPVFAASARVFAPVAGHGRGARTQRLRWEGGRFHVVRTRLVRLVLSAVRTGEWSRLDAALDLAVPPLGLLVLLTAAGAALTALLAGAGVTSAWALAPWLAACTAIPAYVLVGLRAADAPASAYRALLRAPLFVLAKTGTYLRLSRGLHADRWERTERPAAEPAGPPAGGHRVEVAGVPIDAVDIPTAVDAAMAALSSGTLLQVSTVNLHFLVTARRDPTVRAILNGTGLNVADGAPVVWLARLLGHRLPGRVAGADLVPSLLSAAARIGARVFLLGGEDGTAAEAARRLVAVHPGLVVCGVHQPPVAAHGALRNGEILELIAAARADILLVALGHPKQERWIDLNRERLSVSVAIGVGCSLDLIAGRRTRAPLWMQSAGLEWLYRGLHEPRRLLPRYALDAGCLLLLLLPAALSRRVRTATPPPAGALRRAHDRPAPGVAAAAEEREVVGTAQGVRALLQGASLRSQDAEPVAVE
jgi:exopolysaccharide biosynthesis WecB/TagA/CpsF family protein